MINTDSNRYIEINIVNNATIVMKIKYATISANGNRTKNLTIFKNIKILTTLAIMNKRRDCKHDNIYRCGPKAKQHRTESQIWTMHEFTILFIGLSAFARPAGK